MEARIPFSGYYESKWDKEIDSVEEREIERLAEEHDLSEKELGEIFWNRVNYRRAREKIAEEYVGYFAAAFELSLKYNDLTSPKYYNFETDRIFAEISKKSAYKIYRSLGKKRMRQAARRMFTSCDGYISHYSNDIDEWGQLRSWDHNQLYCLLCEYVEDQDDDWEWNLFEDMSEAVWNAWSNAVDWDAVHLEIGKLLGAKEKEEELLEPEDERKFPVRFSSSKDYVDQFIKLNGYAA